VTILVRRRARQDLRPECRVRIGRAAESSLSGMNCETTWCDPADLAAVRAFAAAHGLAVEQEDAGRRTVCCQERRRNFAPPSRAMVGKCPCGGTYRGRRAPSIAADLATSSRPSWDWITDARAAHFRIRHPGGECGGVLYAVYRWHPLMRSERHRPGAVRAADRIGRRIPTGGSGYVFQEPGCRASVVPYPWIMRPIVRRTIPTAGRRSHARRRSSRGHRTQANVRVYFRPQHGCGFLDAITTAIHDTHTSPP